MHEKNEDFGEMLKDVLTQLNIKPNKHSLGYAENFIQSNGGYQEYYNAYKKRKKASNGASNELHITRLNSTEAKIISPIETCADEETKRANISECSLTPSMMKPPTRPPPKPPAPKKSLLQAYATMSDNAGSKQMESTYIGSPNSENSISFISPIPSQNGHPMENKLL
jgi:hypothetical protein